MLTFKTAKPVILLILDGWGHASQSRYNAIAAANTPYWDHLMQTYPHTLLNASGSSVGLPEGQMGNSEVGHLTIGAGRVLDQDLTRLNKAIQTGDFFTNKVFLSALHKANKKQTSIHIIGLLSPGGVHSHEKHIHALLALCADMAIKNCYIHAILDGRDTPPTSAAASIKLLEMQCKKLGVGQIASLTGRYYAMDRDHRWERTQAAYDCIVSGQASYNASTPLNGLQQAYARGETDEFVRPTCLYQSGASPITIESGDIVIFMNFRSDRAIQLSRALIDPDFIGFKRMTYPNLGDFVSLTSYDIPSRVAFPPLSIQNGLGARLAQAGLTQLRIAETEKYAHVTIFFNGGVAQPFPNETRLLIPSKKVTTYDLVPEMAVEEITDQVVQVIEQQSYDVVICNFANPDMLGHTGNQCATEAAITIVDRCIGKIVATLKQKGGEAIITADHGNAECMYDEAIQQPHTAHTLSPVPLLYVGRTADLTAFGTLADVAPTLLALLGLEPSEEMTGKNLVAFK